MFSVIPLPYRILSVAVLLAIWSGFLFYGGWHECAVRQQAKERQDLIAYADAIKQEQARGDKASLDLATAQTTINQLTTEKLRHVHQVTTGRECLSPAAVRLLNANAANGLQKPAGQSAPESTETSATDTDITEWAIESQGLYDTCAIRLNSLIDFLLSTASKPAYNPVDKSL